MGKDDSGNNSLNNEMAGVLNMIKLSNFILNYSNDVFYLQMTSVELYSTS